LQTTLLKNKPSISLGLQSLGSLFRDANIQCIRRYAKYLS
jgi:hypothetical protein